MFFSGHLSCCSCQGGSLYYSGGCLCIRFGRSWFDTGNSLAREHGSHNYWLEKENYKFRRPQPNIHVTGLSSPQLTWHSKECSKRQALEYSFPTRPSNHELPPDLQHELSSHESVFHPWQGLLPRRDYDHSMTLLLGTNSISVRPYKYAYYHKDAIEWQVHKLFIEGIICHSISPFSSLVILVKKKDDSWRMCVDFRALNKVTVLDKYPIPTINELIDELHGFCIFRSLI